MFTPTFRRFLRYVRPYWRLCLGSIICGLFKFSLALLLPTALALVVDYAIQTDGSQDIQRRNLLVIIGLLCLAFLLRAPITFYRTYLAERAGNRTIFDIRTDLYRHIQRLSLSYHGNRRTGETVSRLVSDINASQGILDRGVISASVDFLFLIGVTIALFLLDWRLALVSLSTLPIYGCAIIILNPRLREASRSVQEQVSHMSGEATEKFSGLPVVLSFVREKSEELRFFKSHRAYFNRVLHRTRVQSLQIMATEFLTAAGPLAVIGYGGWQVINGRLDLAYFIIFYGFISHLYLPTRRLADVSALVQEQLAAVDRVFEVLDETLDIVDAPDAKPLRNPAGRVEFDNVTFAYRPNEPVLRGVSLDIEPGRSVALVGRSGAGKTTLANLVPRFWDVQSGAVRVDGHDVRSLQVKSLREHIGIVGQDTILFSGTIRENILYGKRGATEADLLAAARMAHVDEFARTLEHGYDTVIGERGVKLSGGQKQRLSIARAFLRNPAILILDEATSNLDAHAEAVIQDALDQLMHDRTTLLIAHRLSTVVKCDEVAVIDEGRVVQRGPHEILIREPGLYRDLCEEQFGYVQLDELTARG